MNTLIKILTSVFFVISVNSMALELDSEQETKEVYTLTEVMELSREQQELLSCCGPLSLARCLAILGKDVKFDTLRCHFKTKSIKGVELKELLEVAKKYYSESYAIRVSKNDLQSLPLPAILIVDGGKHCLVLENVAVSGKEIAIWDPRNLKKMFVSEEKLGRVWNGEVILFSPISTLPLHNFLLGGLSCVNLILLWSLYKSQKTRTQQTLRDV